MPSAVFAQTHPEIGTELVRDWTPSSEPRAHIILVHGLAEHSGRYERTGTLLADAGFAVRSFDLIGAGGSGGKRWHIEDWGRFHDQVQTHLEWAHGKGSKTVLMGHSIGGAIVLGYLLSPRPQPDLAILSAPALAGGAGWQKAIAPLLAKLAPGLTLPNPVKGEHLSRDPSVADSYFADPLVIPKSTAAFGATAFAEIDRLNEQLAELDIPTLVFHGGDDQLVPTSCSEALGEIPCVERRVYDGLRHETLNEPEGPEIVADIVAWLDRQLG